MAISVKVDGLEFLLLGLAPPGTDYAHADGSTKGRFWATAARIAAEEKDRELAAGLDRLGKPMAPVKLEFRPRFKSGKRLSGPPLTPHEALSRTRRLLVVHRKGETIRLGWSGDWGEVLGYHRAGIPRKGWPGGLVKRDVIGLSPESLKRVANRCAAAWVTGRLDVGKAVYHHSQRGTTVELPFDPASPTAKQPGSGLKVTRYQGPILHVEANTALGKPVGPADYATDWGHVAYKPGKPKPKPAKPSPGVTPKPPPKGIEPHRNQVVATVAGLNTGKVPPSAADLLHKRLKDELTVGEAKDLANSLGLPGAPFGTKFTAMKALKSFLQTAKAKQAAQKPVKGPGKPVAASPAPVAPKVQVTPPAASTGLVGPARWVTGDSAYRVVSAGDDDGIDAWGHREYGSWANGLTRSELQAIRSYTGNGYLPLNFYLRTGQFMLGVNTEQTQIKLKEALDRALASARTPEPLRVFRKARRPQDLGVDLEAIRPGYKVTDPGYLSTSLSSEKFHGRTRLTLQVPKGSPAAYVNAAGPASSHPSEVELLFARGMAWRVIEIQKCAPGGKYDYEILGEILLKGNNNE